MFSSATAFNGDISKWDVSRVTDMSRMFLSAESFNGDISKWDVSHVTDMSRMFRSASSFNADISKWDVSRVVFMNRMLSGATSFDHTFCTAPWVFSRADKKDMFSGSSGSIAQAMCTLARFKSKEELVHAVHAVHA